MSFSHRISTHLCVPKVRQSPLGFRACLRAISFRTKLRVASGSICIRALKNCGGCHLRTDLGSRLESSSNSRRRRTPNSSATPDTHIGAENHRLAQGGHRQAPMPSAYSKRAPWTHYSSGTLAVQSKPVGVALSSKTRSSREHPCVKGADPHRCAGRRHSNLGDGELKGCFLRGPASCMIVLLRRGISLPSDHRRIRRYRASRNVLARADSQAASRSWR